MALLQDEALKRIAARIGEVEAHTAGEIAVQVVARSDDYFGTRGLFAALVALLVGVLAELGPLELSSATELAAEVVAGGVAFWLSGVPALLRLLVPSAVADAAVRERAMTAFVERGVHHTRDESGVLVLLSEDEHRAVVLGDRGVHGRVGDAGWQSGLDKLVAAIRAGDAERGLLELVSEMGAVLAREFPRRADDTNELSDEVQRTER